LGNQAKADLSYIDSWLDANVGLIYKEQPLGQDWARISKIQEELGEVTAAYISATGQNPRKPERLPMNAVMEELADVVCTAMLAIQHFTKDQYLTAEIVDARLGRLAERIREIERRKLELGV
jgi:NTP pyrophosphatase (non-canonical NTP hydrolase)